MTRRKADVAEGRWLTRIQVAELLGCSKATVDYMGERGELVRRRNRGPWRYQEESVRRYVVEDLERLRLAEEIRRDR